MKVKIVSSILILVCFIFVGCGTTKIVTDQNINADIYLNGIKKGQKNIEIPRTGTPKRIELSAKYQGQTLGSISVRRKFEWSTFLIGYFTYGIGFLTAWRFPDQIIIPTTKINSEEDFSPWDMPQKSIWMNPINKSNK